MRDVNWKINQAGYIKNPLFVSYGAFEEARQVLVDCSLGANPLDNLYSDQALSGAFPSIASYTGYSGSGAHGNKKLADFIADRWPTVNAKEVCFASGSHGCISSLSRILGGSRSKIQGYLPTFIPGLLEFSIAGAKVETIRLTAPDYAISVERLLEELHEDSTALYVDNPNNPTGSVLPLAEIATLAKGCAERGVLLIIDEAYADFIEDEASALNLEDKNIICLRSVSKGCGLAGLRVGYIVIRDPELRFFYHELGLHFACSALSADVAAELLPYLNFAKMRREIAVLKEKTLDFITSFSGVTVAATAPSTPVILVNFDRKYSLYDVLMDVGIKTEPGQFFDIGEDYVRLRIPAPSKFKLFCQQWKKAFA